MLRPCIRAFLALWLASASGNAAASFPVRREAVCSLGGDKFSYAGTASSSEWGRRLDGKVYTSWMSPAPLVVCPNGFIEYAESYPLGELAKVEAILREPGFKAIAGESDYFRLGYIFDRLGKPVRKQWWIALQASWQVDGDPARFSSYQQRFLEIVSRALNEPGVTDEEWWAMQAFAANAERQLGRFDAAQSRLAALSSERRPAGAQDWQDRLNLLRKLIAKRDAGVEPEEALPRILRDQKARGVNFSNVDR